MQTTVSLSLAFGKAGDAAVHQLYGWSVPEDGFTWMDGTSAALLLPQQDAPHGLFIELSGWPHRAQGKLAGQEISVVANGVGIGRAFVVEQMRHAWFIPPEVTGRSLLIQIHVAGACKTGLSHDPRTLGYALSGLRLMPLAQAVAPRRRRMAAMPIPATDAAAEALALRLVGLAAGDLALKAESLGANCELGFLQRSCGVEALGLLRFTGVSIDALVSGLDDDFARLGCSDTIDPVPEETTLQDWVVYERRYLLRYHTWVSVNDMNADQVKVREAKRLPFLRRRFLEDIAEGNKIFVHQNGRDIPECDIIPLFLALKRAGANAALLWICPSTDLEPAGLVEEMYPDLYRGYFDQFSQPLVGGMSKRNWLTVLACAWVLHGAE